MYLKFLECFPDEAHLVDIFEYVRMSTDNILKVGAWVNGDLLLVGSHQGRWLKTEIRSFDLTRVPIILLA